MFKKTTASLAFLVAAAAMSAPAFADRGHRDHRHGYGHGHDRHVVVHKHHYVQHRRPVVVHHYHRPAPRPVVVVEQRPHYNVNGAAILAGAVLGAVIVHHAVTSY
jgi:hypothetical protein